MCATRKEDTAAVDFPLSINLLGTIRVRKPEAMKGSHGVRIRVTLLIIWQSGLTARIVSLGLNNVVGV